MSWMRSHTTLSKQDGIVTSCTARFHIVTLLYDTWCTTCGGAYKTQSAYHVCMVAYSVVVEAKCGEVLLVLRKHASERSRLRDRCSKAADHRHILHTQGHPGQAWLVQGGARGG